MILIENMDVNGKVNKIQFKLLFQKIVGFIEIFLL